MNDRIKALRKSLDLTQQEFGDRLGVKRNTIATYETGKSSPSDAAVSLICREFNVNESWLRTGEGSMFIPQSENQRLTDFVNALIKEDDSFKKRLIAGLCNLGEADWDELENLIKKMVGTDKLINNIPSTPEDLEAQYPPVDTQKKTG